MIGVKLNPRQFLDHVAEELGKIESAEIQALADAVYSCYQRGATVFLSSTPANASPTLFRLLNQRKYPASRARRQALTASARVPDQPTDRPMRRASSSSKLPSSRKANRGVCQRSTLAAGRARNANPRDGAV